MTEFRVYLPAGVNPDIVRQVATNAWLAGYDWRDFEVYITPRYRVVAVIMQRYQELRVAESLGFCQLLDQFLERRALIRKRGKNV